MRGKKYLAKNIGLLTISQFGTKLLSFFLVPLYTYVLTTGEYGTYDLYTTTVSLLIPILTLNVADPALRFTMDKNSNRKGIFSICIKYLVISILVASALIGVNCYFNLFNAINEYGFFLLLMFASSALNGVLVNYARGLDKVKDVAISGVVCSTIMISLNLLFLIPLHLGLTGYFLANIIGVVSQCLYLVFRIRVWDYLDIGLIDKKLQDNMLAYSKPLIINNISWWVSSASDRYIVTWFCGMAANGIYSVGYKIPSIINIFQTIFNQAWTLSAVQDYDPEDKNGFFSNMYNTYNFCMTLVCTNLIVLTRFLARILYANDFFNAWKYVPFLMIATVFGALSGYIGAIFAAVKDSKVFAQSSIIGAVVNIVLNLILVNKIGALGAAIATTICYMVTWAIRIITVRKYIKMKLYLLRDSIAYSLLLIQSILFFVFADTVFFYSIQLLIVMIILFLFKREVGSLFGLIKERRGSAIK